MSHTIALDQRVRVRRDQSATRLGPPKFPDRVGVVVARNSVAGDHHEGLWYIQLEETRRAKARVETFWGKELITFTSGSLSELLHPTTARFGMI